MRIEEINITIAGVEYSATRLSKLTGFSVSLFTRMLRQGGGARLDTAAEIAYKLDVSIDDIWNAIVQARKAQSQKTYKRKSLLKAKKAA